MPDYEAVIIGGGPAGLAAGLYLARGKNRTLLIDNDGFGGNIKNVEFIENYPGFSEGASGPKLASEMTTQAVNFGLQMEMAEVAGVELYSRSKCVQLADGRSYTTNALIIACGCRRRKLNIPGERELAGKGLIECALCDGGQFQDKTVMVCGGGDSGVTEALYLTKIASRVFLFEAEPRITASAILQERARANQKLEMRCGKIVSAILGDAQVEAVEILDVATQQTERLKIDGILVDVGMEPNTGFLGDRFALDNQRHILVNDRMETNVPGVFAVGDLRSNSPGQVATAVGDGVTAAIFAQRLLLRS